MSRGWFALVFSAMALTTLLGQQAPTPRFRFERPVDGASVGPVRLPLDVPLLSGTRPFVSLDSVTDSDGETRYTAVGGLSDLRLYESTGREVPYLLVYPPRPEPTWMTATQVLPLAVTKRTSGFEADLGALETVDRIRVNGLPTPLLKRLMLEGSGDRDHWTVLAPEATLFDLPEERMRQNHLAFPAGAYRYLRVTWHDTNSGRVPLPLSVDARRVQEASAAPPLLAAVVVEERPTEPGRSRYRLRLPAARLPIVALRLEVGNDYVMRESVVTEARLSGAQAIPIELGRTTVKRVMREDAAAEALRIPIARPSHAQLDLLIENGNNPPLQLRQIVAEFAQLPFVYFEGTGQPIVARYGDPRLETPQYDLEAAREGIRVDSIPTTGWGEPRERTGDGAPSTPPALSLTGGVIDSTSFGSLRRIPHGPPGLVSLELDPAVLAHSTRGLAGGLADVRIIDGEGRQVPYLLEKRDEPQVVELTPRKTEIQAADFKDRRSQLSAYALSIPYDRLPSPRLVLMTSSSVFARQVTVGVERPSDRQHRDAWFEVLATADWRHDDRSAAAEPPSIVIPLPDGSPRDLRIVVDEGDNAALPLTRARLLLPAYRARFFRAEGADLRLAYGRENLDAPQYDLQLLAAEVLGDAAQDVRATPEADHARPATASLVSPRLFWAVLAIAALVLIVMIVKLVARAPGA